MSIAFYISAGMDQFFFFFSDLLGHSNLVILQLWFEAGGRTPLVLPFDAGGCILGPSTK